MDFYDEEEFMSLRRRIRQRMLFKKNGSYFLTEEEGHYWKGRRWLK